jgi:hypothetical protein
MSLSRCRGFLRPLEPHCAPLVPAIAILVVVLTTALSVVARATSMDPVSNGDDRPQGAGLGILQPLPINDVWSGGSQSLPYGDRVIPSSVLRSARNLAVIQPAISEFMARGYVRRADLDYATVHRGYASAVLAFQRSGVATGEEQVYVGVVTRAITIDGVDCPATQVFGGAVVDSAGIVVPGDPTIVCPLIVLPGTSDTGTGAIPDPSDEDFVFKYSAREFLSDAPHFHATMSTGALALYNAEARSVLNGEIEGVLFGVGGGGGGMVFGAVVGMVFSAQNFWLSPPDTCGCGHIAIEAPPDRLATRPLATRERATSSAVRGGGSIRVLDVQGRLVKDLGDVDFSGASAATRWDHTDLSGHPARAGVYFVVTRPREISGRPEVARVVIAR